MYFHLLLLRVFSQDLVVCVSFIFCVLLFFLLISKYCFEKFGVRCYRMQIKFHPVLCL